MAVTNSTGPYVPRADGAFRDWLNNFAAVAAARREALGISPGEADALVATARRYESAYVRATSPGTRGKPAVAAKNAERRAAWDAVRPVAMRVKLHRGVPAGLKIELGVRPPHESQSPVPRPRSRPTLEVDAIYPGRHRLRYSDPAYPSRYAKPPGVQHLQLLVVTAGRPSRTPSRPGRLVVVTRHVFDVRFEPADDGKVATYFGRWATERGLPGPWSRPLAVRVV